MTDRSHPSQSRLIATCRAHGHWFQIEKVHEPCPEPGCEAACDYYELIPDHRLKALSEQDRCTCGGYWRGAVDGPYVVCAVCGATKEDAPYA